MFFFNVDVKKREEEEEECLVFCKRECLMSIR